MIEYLNRLIHGDCVLEMKKLPDECIPLTVTSPPFDQMRVYGGHPFDFERVARELFRITMPGGVVAWHVREQCRNGKESGTASEQRLFFRNLGFDLYQTLAIDVENAAHDWVFLRGIAVARPMVLDRLNDLAVTAEQLER